MMNLPANVFQELTNNDKKRLDSLLDSSKSKSKSKTTTKNKTSKSFAERGGWNKDERVRELQAMYKYKVELEALHWKGMDYLCKFVYETILGHEKRQRQQDEESVHRRRHRHRRHGHGDYSDSDDSSDNDSIDPESGVDDNGNENEHDDDDDDQDRDEQGERQTYII